MNDDLNFTTDEIRKYYAIKRAKVLGSAGAYIAPTKKNDDAFKAAAKVCIELDAEPEVYVRAQFTLFSDQQLLAKLPALLHHGKAKDYYNDYIQSTTLSFEESFKLQVAYVRDQVELAHRPVVRALLDDKLNLEPWFRICITKEPIKEVIDKYKDDALEVYERSKKLRQFLAEKNLDYTRFKQI